MYINRVGIVQESGLLLRRSVFWGFGWGGGGAGECYTQKSENGKMKNIILLHDRSMSLQSHEVTKSRAQEANGQSDAFS